VVVVSEAGVKDLVCGDYYLVCVGTRLRSDDAAGLRLCELLLSRGFPEDRIVMCEFGLENCTPVIEELSVRNALLIDAALVSGQARETPNYFIASLSSINDSITLVTTHSIPVNLVVELLRREGLFDNVWVLGIIARDLSLGEELSPEVRETVNYLADLIIKALNSCGARQDPL
jgi:hydrogenase maturation protease